MEKKLYLCLVSWSMGADMVVEATSKDEADEIAQKLVYHGRADMTVADNGDVSVGDIEAIITPDAKDKKQAQANAEAWADLQAEENEASCAKCGKSGVFAGGMCESCARERGEA